MKHIYIFVLLLACLVFFGTAGTMRLRIAASTNRSHAEPADRYAGNQPFVVLTKVVLGGFSGIAVDILWMRLISLQAKGKVFEIVQLADWIAKLEPHFTAVWAFHAWNMAYNISILYTNPEHRWLWINNGIQLLRDEALKFNPSEPVLYRELGWIYQHKIGQMLDDMHFYYKIKFAAEMENLFGGPAPKYDNSDQQTSPMRAKYKLLPEIMQSIDRIYGPLDWRLPEAHAIYWAHRGLLAAGRVRNAETIYCDHMIFQSMAAVFVRGRLFYDKQTGFYATTPRIDLLPKVQQSFKDAIRRQDLEVFKESYVAFLSEAVFICHVYGDDETAHKLFDEMLAFSPRPQDAPAFAEYVAKCEQLAITEIPVPDAMAWIEGLLYQSHLKTGPENSTEKQQLREKAFTLWRQRTTHPQYARHAQLFPDFELIDRFAKLRAAGDAGLNTIISFQERRNSK